MDIDSPQPQPSSDSQPDPTRLPEWANIPASAAPPPALGRDHVGRYPDDGQPHVGRSGGWGKRSLAAGALAAVAIGSGTTGAALAGHFSDSTGARVVTTGAPLRLTAAANAATEQLAKVAAAVQPSVVSITVTASGGSDEGSGVILRSDGTVLTNNHVVSAAVDGGSIRVKFADGKTAAATIVGRDPGTDLAVVKASGVSGLTPATLGSSANLSVGDTVLAIGSPLGLDGSVTAGIVSALHRTVDLSSNQQQDPTNPFGQQRSTSSSASVGDAIQTDAAINPGNSGGPLVDGSGAVIGINTAIASLGSSSGNIGLGFAIPVDEVKSVADQLIGGKTPQHALLGVQITDDPSGGAAVTAVTSNGSAAKAGLRAGDVITKLGATPIEGGSSLAAAVRSHRPGEQVTVSYRRNGEQRTTTVTFGSAAQ